MGHRRHLDPQVDPVAQGTGYPPGISLGNASRASAGAVLRARTAARARVHRGDQLESCREGHGSNDPDDRDPAVLERLPEAFENVAPELGQLVEEQDAGVGSGHLPRSEAGPTAQHPGIADRVVRGAKRPGAHELAKRAVAGRRQDRGGHPGLRVGERREQPRDRTGQERLARSRRTDEEQPMTACQTDLERPSTERLAADIGQIGHLPGGWGGCSTRRGLGRLAGRRIDLG